MAGALMYRAKVSGRNQGCYSRQVVTADALSEPGAQGVDWRFTGLIVDRGDSRAQRAAARGVRVSAAVARARQRQESQPREVGFPKKLSVGEHSPKKHKVLLRQQLSEAWRNRTDRMNVPLLCRPVVPLPIAC